MRPLALVLAMLLLLVAPAAAQQQSSTVMDVLEADDAFEIVLQAIIAAELEDTLRGPGPFTVFAPTDGSWRTYRLERDTSPEAIFGNQVFMRQLLLYHVVPGLVTEADFLTVGVPVEVTTINGGTIRVTLNETRNRFLFNNGRAQTVTQGTLAGNGIVYRIDNVLPPPQDTAVFPAIEEPSPLQGAAAAPVAPFSLVDALEANGNVSTLLAALRATGLDAPLNAPGEFTLFAPSNGAFDSYFNETGTNAGAVLANPDALRPILEYHVVPGAITANAIRNLARPITVDTINGRPLVLGLNSEELPQLILNNGRAFVTVPDNLANNGVYHVLDNVLLPQ